MGHTIFCCCFFVFTSHARELCWMKIGRAHDRSETKTLKWAHEWNETETILSNNIGWPILSPVLLVHLLLHLEQMSSSADIEEFYSTGTRAENNSRCTLEGSPAWKPKKKTNYLWQKLMDSQSPMIFLRLTRGRRKAWRRVSQPMVVINTESATPLHSH